MAIQVIKEMSTNRVFSKWRINGEPSFVDMDQQAGQIAFYTNEDLLEITIAMLQGNGHAVYPRDLEIK